MVLAQLALAEGIFSQARTDSVLFLSKAVETTVRYRNPFSLSKIQLLNSMRKH